MAQPLAALTGADERFDFFVHDLSYQKMDHLCIVGEQVQFHLDRLVENLNERIYRKRFGLHRRDWCLLGVCTMLVFHERVSYLGDGSSNKSPGKSPVSVSNFNQA